MKTILIVDDEPRIVELARDYLVGAGFSVRRAGGGEEALAMARAESPDLIVLDLGLPDLDGLDVTRRLRRDSDVPIIMLTARGAEADKLVGLELGADDYVTKPFSPRELVARVRAVLRRAEERASPRQAVHVGDLSLDFARRKAALAGRSIELTTSEFQLLFTLASQPGRIFTRSQLLDALHGTAFESYERAIDAHIKNLRKKIEADPRRPRYVLTVYGVGYKLREEDEA
ncbi:MAG TPA: response regulator transcription factor [Anaerolineales bacterium]